MQEFFIFYFIFFQKIGSFITRQERRTFGASFSGLFAFEPNTSLPEG
jgi:hypothetical protein